MVKKGYTRFLYLMFFVAGIVILNLNFFINYYIVFGDFGLSWAYESLLIISNVIWISSSFYFDIDVHERDKSLGILLKKLLIAFITYISLLNTFIIFAKLKVDTHFIVVNYILFVITILIWRLGFLYALHFYRKRGFSQSEIIFIGNGSATGKVKAYFSKHKEYGFKLLPFGTDRPEKLNEPANYEALIKRIEQTNLHRIYVTLESLKHEGVKKLVSYAENNLIRVYIVNNIQGIKDKTLEITSYTEFSLINISMKPLDDYSTRIIKRAFDILFSFFVIVLFSPIFLSLMLIIYGTSKGPIFFRQTRIGKFGKPFKIIKFRSMVHGAETNGPQLSSDNDPRTTSIGRFLRKTRLDELPNFINVLLGDMSIVGPRPERQFYIEQIIKKAPEYRRLHWVRPGITSLGQLKYGYASTVEEMIKRQRYDNLYINNFSFLLDLKLIFLTIIDMVHAKGK